jgi:hypothetical protein
MVRQHARHRVAFILLVVLVVALLALALTL